MFLNRKLHVRPTRKENSLVYHISTTSTDYQKNSFFRHSLQCQTGIVCPRTLFVHQPLNPSGLASLHEIPLQSGTPPLDYWWKGVATLPWGERDYRQSLWHCDCWLNTFYTSHCQLPDMVWSIQKVEVWQSTEEEEFWTGIIKLNSVPSIVQNFAAISRGKK